MPVKILMPALSPTMKSGVVARWHKKEGDSIRPGDILADIETDKAVMEFEYADEPGVLHRVMVQDGARDVLVNSVLAVVRVGNEDVASVEAFCTQDCGGSAEVIEEAPSAPDSTSEKSVQRESATLTEPSGVVHTPSPTATGQRLKASPLARKIAAQMSVDITKISGTGPYGRVIKDDVLAAAGNGRTGSAVEQRLSEGETTAYTVELTSMRRVIAERLLESKTTVPHFYVAADCMVGKLLKLRAEINHSRAQDARITVNDFVLKAVALAMKECPEVNSSWEGDKIRRYRSIDVSFAVSIDDGLITPVVRNVDAKSLSEVSSSVKELATKAKDRKLQPHEFQGGGFTVSNLGMFGVREFYAIVNPPQSCIMAVGASEKRPVVAEDGCIVAADVMTVTLSVDHRVVDGALAAKFLNRFKAYLEDPLSMLT
ncbi:MAG: pyruvate dehydrogenase complex dihydrolipoamide acetyltransferase [Anaplasma sp.]